MFYAGISLGYVTLTKGQDSSARTCAQNGTEKDSQEGLKMDPPGKRKHERPKSTLR